MSILNVSKRRTQKISDVRRAAIEALEQRQLLTVTPAIMLLGDATALSGGATITDWPAGVALQLQTVRDVSLSTDLPSDGSTFVSPSTPNNVRFSWNFGDTAMATESDYMSGPRQSQNVLTGFNAAHIYDAAGTYTVTLTCVDQAGNSTSTSITVNVDSTQGTASTAPLSSEPVSFGPSTSNTSDTTDHILYVDNNATTISAEGGATVAGTSPIVVVTGGVVTNGPFTSFSQAATAIATSPYLSGAQIRFRAGDTFSITSLGTPLSNTNLLIGSYDPTNSGAPLTSQAIFDGASKSDSAFSPTSSAANWTIQDIKFENLNDALAPQGMNITIRDCNFSEMENDIVTSLSAPFPLDGVLVQGCVDTTPASDFSNYVIYGEGSDWVVINNTFTGGSNPTGDQPYIRFDSSAWVNHGVAFEDNTVNDHYGEKSTDLTVKGEYNFVYIASNNFLEGHINVGNGAGFSTTTTSSSDAAVVTADEPQDNYVLSGGTYTIYGPSENGSHSNVADLNWAVMDGNRVVGSYIQGDGGDTNHFMVRNNVVERYSTDAGTNNMTDEAYSFVTRFTNLAGTNISYGDLELINNTGYSTYSSNSGAVFDLQQTYLFNVVFANNLAVDPDATGTSSYVDFRTAPGTTYTTISGNDWFDPSGAGTTNEFELWIPGGAQTNISFNTWNSTTGSSPSDTYAKGHDTANNASIIADSTYTSDTASLVASGATVASVDDSASYDFYGNPRPSTGSWVAGAVEGLSSLTLTGTATNDTIYLKKDSGSNSVDVWQNTSTSGSPTAVYSLSTISQIIIDGSTGGEAVTVDWSGGIPLPTGGLSINGATSTTNTLLVIATTGNDTVTSTSSQLTLNGIATSFSNQSSVLLNPDGGTDSITVSSGSLKIPANPVGGGIVTDNLSVLSVSSGATLSVANPTTNHSDRTVLLVTSLSVASGADLDMGGNDMIDRGADTAAGFTGGFGSSSSDQYPGVSGSGWSTAWSSSSAGDTINTATVASSSPLNSGGNYFSYSDTSTAANGLAGIGRAYSTSGFGVDTGAGYTITFDYRLDAGLSNFTSINDRIAIFGDSAQNFGTQNGNTWVASVYGATDGALAAKDWGFENSDKMADGDQTFVDTGMPLVQGTVYHFVINVNPSALTYTATLSNGTSVYDSGQLGFRTNTVFSSSTPTYVNFTDRHALSSTTTSWSLDSITVSDQARIANSLLASGYNSGGWNGSGISSSAAASDPSHVTALGEVSNSVATGALYSTFDGQTVFATDVLIKFTYDGDANLDGVVNASDYTLTDTGFNLGLSGWYNGDYNYDGSINASDYTLIDNGDSGQGAPL
jgi:trimeric autotransporter adhesin